MSKILSPQIVKFPIWLFQNNKMGHRVNKWWPHFHKMGAPKIQNGMRQLYEWEWEIFKKWRFCSKWCTRFRWHFCCWCFWTWILVSLLVLVFSGIDSGACCQIPLVVGFQTRTLVVAYSRQGRDRGGAPVYRQERATHIDRQSLRTKQNCLYSLAKVKWKM